MAASFTPSDEGLIYQERRTGLLRSFIAAVGLTAIVSSYVFIELMRQTGWPATGAQWGGLAASLLGLLSFCGFGAFCLRMAFHLTGQTVQFERAEKQLVYGTHSMARGQEVRRFPFSDITALQLTEHKPEDGTATFAIAMDLQGGMRIEMGAFNRRRAAQAQLEALRVLTGRAD